MRLLFLMAFLSLISCQSMAKSKEKYNLLEMQEDLQRFYSRFTERVVESLGKNNGYDTNHLRLVQEYMLYDSEALKITTGPFPVVNFLDMMVFIKLNRLVVKEYWVPKVLGKNGKGLERAFLDSEKDINQLASKYTDPKNVVEVNKVVKKWREANPHQIRVEKVRLADFSKFASVKAGKKSTFSLSHLVVDTQGAVQAVDDVVLLSNRAIFLAQNIPLIIRLQARVGAMEIMGDAVSTIQGAPKLIHEAQPMVNDLTSLAREADKLIRDANNLLNTWKAHRKGKKRLDVHETLSQVDGILDKSSVILTQLNDHGSLNKNVIQEIKSEIYKIIWFIALMIIFIGMMVSAAWWTGSYLSKKKLMKV